MKDKKFDAYQIIKEAACELNENGEIKFNIPFNSDEYFKSVLLSNKS